MKRKTLLLAVLMVLLMLVGCGSGNATEPSKTTGQAAQDVSSPEAPEQAAQDITSPEAPEQVEQDVASPEAPEQGEQGAAG